MKSKDKHLNKVVVFFTIKSSFIENDILCLKKTYQVEEYAFGIKRSIRIIPALLKQLLWCINNLKEYKKIYIWFADTHGFLPILFSKFYKKPIITFVGGYDAVKIPEFKYGVHINPVRSIISKFVCRNSNKIITSSRITAHHLIQTLNYNISLEKVKTYYPKIDESNYKLVDSQIVRKRIVYVALGESINRMKIKGVDRYVELTKALPDIEFTIIGPSGSAINWLNSFNCSNLEIIPPVNKIELAKIFNQSIAICLFSRFEAFGMVVAEAMLCGCFPIILKTIGIAEVLVNKIEPSYIHDYFNVDLISNEVLKLHMNFSADSNQFESNKNLIRAIIQDNNRCQELLIN